MTNTTRVTPDYKFNETMTRAALRGIRFADTPIPTFKRESGLPVGYFSRSWCEILFNWRQ